MPEELDAGLTMGPSLRGWGGVGHRDQRLDDVYSVLREIEKGAVQRENSRTLPYAEVAKLRSTGFPLARIERARGGFGATLPELFELIITVAEADPNLAQIFRSHFGFVEHVLMVADDDRRDTWIRRLEAGDIVAAAATEVGRARREVFATSIVCEGGQWRLNGEKAYATGALFADWIEVEAICGDGEGVAVAVRRSAPGVSVLDDWTGMGQTLSASGSVAFSDVLVDPSEMVRADPFPYYEAFYQLYLLAIIAGIGRAASNDASSMLATRKRSFSHGNSDFPRHDSQLLQIIGEVRSDAYAAGACVLHAARALQCVADNSKAGNCTADAIERADVEVWQAQGTVTKLVLAATSRVFDALGASATLRESGLDRHWRNARTLASHNPTSYKARIVGDFSVNGTKPPGQWRIGIAEPMAKPARPSLEKDG